MNQNISNSLFPDVQNPTFDFSSIKCKWLNVPYADKSAAQKLDIFLPNDNLCYHPTVVIIHGGGFMFGDKEGIELEAALEPGLERGYAIVSINYRLSTEAIFPAAPQDVNAAIRFLRKNAFRYRLDPNHIGLWGSSSGGNLASLAGVTDKMTVFVNPELGDPNIAWNVNAVVDFYGPINFLTMDPEYVINGLDGQIHDSPNSFESKYLGAQITTVPWLVKESNPQTYLNTGMPAFLIEHGTKDLNIPYQQSVIFSQLLADYLPDTEVSLRLIDGAQHGGPQFETPENTDLVFSFFDKYLKCGDGCSFKSF
ncbi:MAG: alpha/beta hydrolase [Oscillospiraceae bacterium]|nr:alpha/beta hydrolase [Oscillospiraceae bacterium]